MPTRNSCDSASSLVSFVALEITHSEIAEEDLPLAVQEDVGRLNVAMHYSQTVQVGQRSNESLEYVQQFPFTFELT